MLAEVMRQAASKQGSETAQGAAGPVGRKSLCGWRISWCIFSQQCAFPAQSADTAVTWHGGSSQVFQAYIYAALALVFTFTSASVFPTTCTGIALV
eukprot:1160941-Pelagomonas_calceolata.AAC.12